MGQYDCDLSAIKYEHLLGDARVVYADGRAGVQSADRMMIEEEHVADDGAYDDDENANEQVVKYVHTPFKTRRFQRHHSDAE